MKRRILSGLLSLLLAVPLALIIWVAPAQAVTCQNLHVCLWKGAAYTDTLVRYGVPGGTGGTGCHTLSGSTMNNNAESMANGSPRFINFYDTTNCTGTIITWMHAAGGAVDERSSDGGAGWRNRIGSFKYCGSNVPC